MDKEYVFTLPEKDPTVRFYFRVSQGSILMDISPKDSSGVSVSLDESSYRHMINNLGSDCLASAFRTR